MLTRAASADLPIAASNAVPQVPTFAPRIKGIAASSGISPSLASAMVRPSVAAELCTIAVKTAPITMPSSGFFMVCIASMNGRNVRSG